MPDAVPIGIHCLTDSCWPNNSAGARALFATLVLPQSAMYHFLSLRQTWPQHCLQLLPTLQPSHAWMHRFLGSAESLFVGCFLKAPTMHLDRACPSILLFKKPLTHGFLKTWANMVMIRVGGPQAVNRAPLIYASTANVSGHSTAQARPFL